MSVVSTGAETQARIAARLEALVLQAGSAAPMATTVPQTVESAVMMGPIVRVSCTFPIRFYHC